MRSADAQNEALTGADIKDQSGVDTCTHGTVRFGELCVGVANEHHTWVAGSALCANLGLRQPSFGEGLALAKTHDIPGLEETEAFWTDQHWREGDPQFANAMFGTGDLIIANINNADLETVCATTPTH